MIYMNIIYDIYIYKYIHIYIYDISVNNTHTHTHTHKHTYISLLKIYMIDIIKMIYEICMI